MANNQTLRFTFEFDANINKAKQKAQDLQQTLNKVLNSSVSSDNFQLTPKLQEAQQTALALKQALHEATNQDTGKLNLNKFSNSLRKAGIDVNSIGKQLTMLGPEGQKAMQQITQSVIAADKSFIQLSGGLKKMMNTFMNTVRYQAATSAINAMTSAIKDTIDYAKDLDKSLTNIRVVTGKSADQMAKFAKTANTAAKELATSTKNYTDASLIYFQQGLNEAEVRKRTDTTIKLANAVGQSSEEVSNWMTAIWNNFDDGSESLEYYADVLAKLGAETASSADEIAAGLEKFAAVGDTIGLSYEYAASALATITAETRQSADVVGTALKTIFSRMEGLKLGETLDDGTTLNQYSAALMSVGVNIKDTSGELKDMDTILNETADRWQTLGKDQQIALAQGVAGVRQYTQFIALMDNWDVMEKNIQSTKEASGALEDMQEIYEDSLEGAQKKAQASGEALKQSLLMGDDMKDFYNTIAKITDVVTFLVESLGGLPTILSLVATAMAKIYQPQISKFIRDTAMSVQDLGRKAMGQQTHGEALANNIISQNTHMMQQEQYGGDVAASTAGKMKGLEESYVANGAKMTANTREALRMRLELLAAIRESVIAQSAETVELQEQSLQYESMRQDAIDRGKAEAELASKPSRAAGLSSSVASLNTGGHTQEVTNKTATTEILGSLNAVKREALELGVVFNDIDMSTLENELRHIQESGTGNIEAVKNQLTDLISRIQNAKAETSSGFVLNDVNAIGLEETSQAVGSMKASGARAEKLVGEMPKEGATDEQRALLGNQAQSALDNMKAKAEEIGIEVDDMGFDQMAQEIEKYVQDGTADLDALLKKIKSVNEQLAEAGKQAQVEASDDAIAGAMVDGFMTDKDRTQAKAEAGAKSQEFAKDLSSGSAENAVGKLKDKLAVQKKGSDKKSTSQADKKFLKNLQAEAKALDVKKKRLQELQKITKRTNKEEAEMAELQKTIAKDTEKLTKKVEAHVTSEESYSAQLKEQIKDTDGFRVAQEGMQESMDATAQGNEELGRSQQETADAQEDFNTMVEDTNDKMNDAAGNSGHWADGLSAALGSTMQMVSGLQMLSTGFESLGKAMSDGKLTWEEFGSIATSVLSGLITTFPVVISLIDAMRKAQKKKADESVKDAAKEAGSEGVKKAGVIGTAVANVVQWITKGPAGWVIAAIGAAALVGVGVAMAVSATNKGAKEGEKEQNEAMIEQTNTVLEAADANQELAKEVDDLIGEYHELNALGEDASEVYEKMNEKIPELIANYRELADTMQEVDGDTSKAIRNMTEELEDAYELAQLTGDFSDFEKKKAELDDTIAIAEAQTAKRGSTSASKNLVSSMTDTQGKVKDGKFTLNVGGSDGSWSGETGEEAKARNVLANTMGDYYTKGSDAGMFTKTGAKLSVNTEDPLAVVDFYEKMQEAKIEMENSMTSEELDDSDIYREIKEQLEATAESYETAKEQADKFKESASSGIEAQLARAMGDPANMNMEEYLKYREQYVALAQEEYGLSKEMAEQLLAQSKAGGRNSKEYELAQTIAVKFGGVSEEDAANLADDYYKQFSKQLEGMSDEEVAIAVGVALNTESMEEFNRELPHALASAQETAYQAISENIGKMISDSTKDQQLSAANMAYLQGSEEFANYLQDLGKAMGDFNTASYSEQIAMLQGFNQQVQQMAAETSEYQQGLYYGDLAAKQDQLMKALAMEDDANAKAMQKKYQEQMELANDMTKSTAAREAAKAEAEEIANTFEQTYEIDIEMNSAKIKSQIAEIENKIEEINQQQIDIAIKWDGIDEIEQMMETSSKFAKVVESDMKKVNGKYQMTAATMGEWAEMYPDLFKQAKVTSNGLIELNQDVVDDFIKGQDGQTDSVIENKIDQLKTERATIEAKYKAREADLKAAQVMANGELQLENMSAEAISQTRKQLTEYYMELYNDEEKANAAALHTMGLNQQEYADLISGVAKANAVNMANADQSMVDTSFTAVGRILEFFTNLGESIGAIFKAIVSGESIDWSEIWNPQNSKWKIEPEIETVKVDDYELTPPSQQYIDAAFDNVSAKLTLDFDEELKELQKGLDSIDSQIIYLEALKTQDFEDFGETEIDDDDNGATAEELKEVLERYHEITREIQALERATDRYSKAADKAWGPEKLKYMKLQLQTMQATEKKQRDLLLAQQGNLILDKAKVQSEDMFNGKALFDEYGNIANYTELLQEATEAYNKVMETGGEEEKENAEKLYEDRIAALEQYEETLDAVKDQEDTLIDLNNEMASLALETISYEVEYKVDLADKELERLEWQIDNLTDAVGDAAEKFMLLGKSIEANVKKAEAAKKGITDILGTTGLELEEIMNKTPEELGSLLEGKTLSEEQINNLQQYVSDLQGVTNEMEAQFDQYSDTIIASFEDMNKEFNKSIENIEHMNSMMDGYRNIIDLVGKDALGISDELLAQMSKTQYEMANNNITVVKEQLEMNKAALLSLEQEIAEARAAGDERTVKELEEAYDEMYATVQENEQSLLDATSAALEARTKMFEDQMNSIMNTFEDAMSGAYGSFTAMQEAYNQQKELGNRYVDDYEKIYNLSKLTRDVTNSIDSTDSIKGKERLRDLQEEINKLQESGAKMTQYEVEELRARYDLRVAEIALEEAQNAKQTVRMKRDASGNWGYVYTADQNAVDAAMQKYEDTLYNYQKKMQDYTDELLDRLISIPQEYAAAVRAIYEDQTLTDEERRLRIQETQQYYQEMYGHVIDQMGIVTEDARILYQEDWTRFSEATGYKISDNSLWVDSFAETVAANILGFEDLDEMQWWFQDQSTKMLASVEAAYVDYQKDVKATLDTAGLDAQNFSGTIKKYMGEVGTAAEKAAKKAEEMGKKNADAFKTAVDGIANKMGEYSKQIDAWNQKTASIGTAVDAVIAKYRELFELADTEVPPPKAPEGGSGYTGPLSGTTGDVGGSGGGGSGNGGNGGSGNGGDDNGAKTKVTVNGYNSWDSKTGKGTGSATKYNLTDATSVKDLAAGQSMVLKDKSNTRDLRVLTKNADGTTTERTIHITNANEAKAVNNAFGTKLVTGVTSTSTTVSIQNINGQKHNISSDRLKKATFTQVDDQKGQLKIPSTSGSSTETIYIGKSQAEALGYKWKKMDVDPPFEVGDKVKIRSDAITKKLKGINSWPHKATAVWMYDYGYDGTGKQPWRAPGATITLTGSVTGGVDGKKWWSYAEGKGKTSGGGGQLYIRDDCITKLDTGGYTGEWDSSGRLAMLHQKEIVLNAHDTANFLSAIDILRDITKVIDLQALAQSNMLSSMTAATVGAHSQVIEQEVTIHAEFPNATNHSEIEEAFNTLLNRASQFANRKN